MVDIQLTDITTGTVNGSGVFDKLMVAVREHITEEFDNGRIKGSDYANVYLGALQGVLAQSVEYVLREKLTEVQIEASVTETNIKQEQHTIDLAIKRTQQVKLDKETAMLGMDSVMKTTNTSPDSVYTPKYGGV